MYEFPHPDRVVVGALGPVGERIFVIQVRQGEHLVAVSVRREAALSIARRIDSLLREAAALGWLGEFWASGGPAVVLLMLAGGLVYSLGALAYGTRRPRLNPRLFGFHEVFHACTIAAAICHGVAIGLAVF